MNDLQKCKVKILGYSIIVSIGFSVVGLMLGSALTAIILYLYFRLSGSQCMNEMCGYILIWFSTVMGLMMASLRVSTSGDAKRVAEGFYGVTIGIGVISGSNGKLGQVASSCLEG